MFAHKYGGRIMQALIDGISLDGDIEAICANYKTAALMIVEMVCADTVQEFLLFVLGIQQVAVLPELGIVHRCNLHSVTLALLTLIGRCTGVNSLIKYAERIVEQRRDEAPFLLPPLLETERALKGAETNLPHLLVDKLALVECLQGAGMEHARLQSGTPYSLNQADNAMHRGSWVEAAKSGRNSLPDANAYNVDADSVNSSPGVSKRNLAQEFNFESMKRVLAEPTERAKREAREKQIQIAKAFRENEFEDLIRRTEPKHDVIQNRLNELFNSLGTERQMSQTDGKPQKAIYETHFPELFFY